MYRYNPLCTSFFEWGKQENGSGHSYMYVTSSSFTSALVHRESKRKTAAIMSLRNDERLFADAALSTVSCFSGLTLVSIVAGECELLSHYSPSTRV